MNTAVRHWARDAVFYHIYPLGLCGAPARNDFASPAVPRLKALRPWVDHIAGLGATAVYLGPLFESATHGYDTADYFTVDRRLGDDRTLKEIVDAFHARGVRVVLDAVFNHAGRDFRAFREFRNAPHDSPYRDWFSGVSFDRPSPFGDPFTYDTWSGCYELVKLDLTAPGVKAHLFEAVRSWTERFGIDGLRLDAAECMDYGFLRELAAHCRTFAPGFWLMGEAVASDYRRLVTEGGLDSVTDYESYKGLYSSHNDRNYHEIAWTLDRLFGEHGLCRDVPLYNFADNHDVDRVASSLRHPEHLFPLYALLFTMPGIPSVYYGSEWGTKGRKRDGTDSDLRPRIDLAACAGGDDSLLRAIRTFARIRRGFPPLRYGSYRQLAVAAEQLVFARETDDTCAVVAVNASGTPAAVRFSLPPGRRAQRLVDLLNPGDVFPVVDGAADIPVVHPRWARIMRCE